MKPDDAYFQTRLSYEPKRDEIWKPIVKYLQRFIPEKARVLELGAGYCSFINQVQALERHALDVSDVVKKHAADDVKVHVRNCTNLRSFGSNAFDTVFSSFLFEHLDRNELNRVMLELRRILRTGGVMITLLPNFKYIYRHYFDDYTHQQVFSHLSFADYLISMGFELVEVQGRFIPYSFKSRFPKSAFLTELYLKLPWRPFAGNMLVVARNPTYVPPDPQRSSRQTGKTGGDRRSSRRQPNSARRKSPDTNRKESVKNTKLDTQQSEYKRDDPIAPVSVLKDGHRTRAKSRTHGPAASGRNRKNKRDPDQAVSEDRNVSRSRRSQRVHQSEKTRTQDRPQERAEDTGDKA
jgi:SAM-dependent methyltransferase